MIALSLQRLNIIKSYHFVIIITLMEEMGKGKVWAKGSGATGCLLDGSLEDSKEFLAL